MSAIAQARAFLAGDASLCPQAVVDRLLAHVEECALLNVAPPELIDAAFAIADESAVNLIECETRRVMDDWHDLDTVDPEVDLAKELRYAERRGLIRRHAVFPRLVKAVRP